MKLVLLILVYVVMCAGCIYPATESIVSNPDRPEMVEREFIALDMAENITVFNPVGNVSVEPIPFNVSISFDGMNGSKNKIVVEIPSFVINSTPIITCGDTEYSPVYVIPGNVSTYFYECGCSEKGVLVFGEYNVTFFVLGVGDGWDFNLTHSVNAVSRSAAV